MKTMNRPGNPGQKQSVPGPGKNLASPGKNVTNPGKNKSNATNPKKPNNDPDQTPTREVENLPVAKPQKNSGKK